MVIFLVFCPPDHLTASLILWLYFLFLLFLYRTDNCIVLLCECSHYLKLSSDYKTKCEGWGHLVAIHLMWHSDLGKDQGPMRLYHQLSCYQWEINLWGPTHFVCHFSETHLCDHLPVSSDHFHMYDSNMIG